MPAYKPCRQFRDLNKGRPVPWRRWTARNLINHSDEPLPFVNIELHQTFVSHFQQEGLARLLIHKIGAFHDLVQFERLLAERAPRRTDPTQGGVLGK